MMTMLQNGDCLDEMRDLAAGCVDAIVTDPPYGLAFMGSKWDNFGGKSCGNDSAEVRRQKAEEYAAKNSGAPRYANGHGGAPTLDAMRSFQSAMTPIFAEALRVAKPGAHLLAFGGTRTYHRLACAIEDAGWEVRDCIMWVYGSGFPKSMDVSKAIDKMKGAEREVVGISTHGSGASLVKLQNHGKGDTGIGIMDGSGKVFNVTAPATPEAAAWNGWGTCLKPAVEPIVVARKPLEGTVAANVLKYGTGAINIDGCRVPTEEVIETKGNRDSAKVYGKYNGMTPRQSEGQKLGRFPANLIHDGSDEVLAMFPDNAKGGTWQRTDKARHFNNNGASTNCVCTGKDTSVGSAARFFYCAKASRSERGEGNIHPTVKPLALMRYLVRLVTRKGGIVLDPFMGSGTTGIAAIQEGMNFIGIERDPHYYEIAQRRISQAKREPEGPIQLDLFAQTEGEKPCS